VFRRAKGEGLCLTFDDVLVVPDYSEVVPADVDVATSLSDKLYLKVPLVSADMDTVTGADMACAMARAGGIGFLWKSGLEEQLGEVERVKRTLNTLVEDPAFVDLHDTKEEVIRTLEEYGNRFSSLVVLGPRGNVVGLVTGDRTNLARAGERVMDFMIQQPITAPVGTKVGEAYDIMRAKKVPKLILVGPNNELEGLYCVKDVQREVEGESDQYTVDSKGRLRVGANVGVNDLDRVGGLLERKCDAILVGTAHGHSENVINTVREIRDTFGDRYDFTLVAGNVATAEGARALYAAGADCVKAGIGPGSICTTRVVAGVGVPQMSVIYDVCQEAMKQGGKIIADGGIKNSGDAFKALALGADAVMMGGTFAGTDESPGEVVVVGGQMYKRYRGMGSSAAMKDNAGSLERYAQTTGKAVPEGVEGLVPSRGPVGEVVLDYVGGIRSGMGYVGAASLLELYNESEFVRVTRAGQVEGRPHDIEVTREDRGA